MLARVLESGNATVLASDSVVGSGLGGVGKTQVALDYAERVWASGRAELVVWVTASSRETLTARSNLAHWRGESGDVAGAAAALEELLADRLRVLGPDHPDTLIIRSSLAHLTKQQTDDPS